MARPDFFPSVNELRPRFHRLGGRGRGEQGKGEEKNNNNITSIRVHQTRPEKYLTFWYSLLLLFIYSYIYLFIYISLYIYLYVCIYIYIYSLCSAYLSYVNIISNRYS